MKFCTILMLVFLFLSGCEDVPEDEKIPITL